MKRGVEAWEGSRIGGRGACHIQTPSPCWAALRGASQICASYITGVDLRSSIGTAVALLGAKGTISPYNKEITSVKIIGYEAILILIREH